MKRLILGSACSLCIGLLAVSCGPSDIVVFVDGEPDTLSITIVSPDSVIVETLSMDVGETAWLSAMGFNALGLSVGTVTATWESVNPGVASVTRNEGLVSANAEGSTLIVAALESLTATVPVMVNALPPPPPPTNVPPVAVIAAPTRDTTIFSGESICYLGTASDQDGSVVAHNWQFGDGGSASVEDPCTYTHSAIGEHLVRYRVTDDQGATHSATRRVTVADTANPPPPPSGGPAFISNFEGADWRDNGKWQAVGGSNHDTYLQIFTTAVDPDVAGGRGLRTRGPSSGQNGDNFWNVIRPTSASQPPTPAVGESITWRFYYKLISGDGDGDYHPIDWGTALLNSGPNFAVFKFVWFNGAWQPQLEIQGAPRPWYSTAQSVLAPNVWYRFEVGWNRTGSSSWTVSYRIYNPSGTLIVDGDDMLGNFGSEPSNLLSAATFNNSNAVRSAMLEIGSPGVGGLSGSPHEAERYAAIAAFVGPPVENVPFIPSRGW